MDGPAGACFRIPPFHRTLPGPASGARTVEDQQKPLDHPPGRPRAGRGRGRSARAAIRWGGRERPFEPIADPPAVGSPLARRTPGPPSPVGGNRVWFLLAGPPHQATSITGADGVTFFPFCSFLRSRPRRNLGFPHLAPGPVRRRRAGRQEFPGGKAITARLFCFPLSAGPRPPLLPFLAAAGPPRGPYSAAAAQSPRRPGPHSGPRRLFLFFRSPGPRNAAGVPAFH